MTRHLLSLHAVERNREIRWTPTPRMRRAMPRRAMTICQFKGVATQSLHHCQDSVPSMRRQLQGVALTLRSRSRRAIERNRGTQWTLTRQRRKTAPDRTMMIHQLLESATRCPRHCQDSVLSRRSTMQELWTRSACLLEVVIKVRSPSRLQARGTLARQHLRGLT